MSTDELQSQLGSKKDDLLNLLENALRLAGITGVNVDSIRLNTKKGPIICPDGKAAVWEAVHSQDGTSVSFKWVCK